MDPARAHSDGPSRRDDAGHVRVSPQPRARGGGQSRRGAIGEIAVVRSWEFVPSGKRAVLTRGRLRFTLYSVGGGASSSSSLVDLLTGTLSTSAVRGSEAIWYVNGFRNATERVIADVGLSSKYRRRVDSALGPVHWRRQARPADESPRRRLSCAHASNKSR